MVACRTKCTSHYLVMVSNLMTFAILVRIFISCVLLPKWLSVIRGMKRKPYLSAVWTCYHFVAITNLRQPRPGDSADMNTRLQISDTSSIRHAWWIPLILHIEKSIIHSSSQKNFFKSSTEICYRWWMQYFLLILIAQFTNFTFQHIYRCFQNVNKTHCHIAFNTVKCWNSQSGNLNSDGCLILYSHIYVVKYFVLHKSDIIPPEHCRKIFV